MAVSGNNGSVQLFKVVRQFDCDGQEQSCEEEPEEMTIRVRQESPARMILGMIGAKHGGK